MEVELLQEIVKELRYIQLVLIIGFGVTWLSLWNLKKENRRVVRGDGKSK